jgi:hypothetical protein
VSPTINCAVGTCNTSTQLGDSAFCPTGKSVLGGGVQAYDKNTGKANNNFQIDASIPGSGSWFGLGHFTTTVTTDTYEMDVEVICST